MELFDRLMIYYDLRQHCKSSLVESFDKQIDNIVQKSVQTNADAVVVDKIILQMRRHITNMASKTTWEKFYDIRRRIAEIKQPLQNFYTGQQHKPTEILHSWAGPWGIIRAVERITDLTEKQLASAVFHLSRWYDTFIARTSNGFGHGFFAEPNGLINGILANQSKIRDDLVDKNTEIALKMLSPKIRT